MTDTAHAPASTCPNCDAPRESDGAFCEVCGYDFASGTLPAPTVVAAPAEELLRPVWTALVTADRAYYDRTDVEDMTFPDHCPERTFTLTDDEILIGRSSARRGIQPAIDLRGAPEDSGVSHSHALLKRQPDGAYAVIDVGSTNGTMLNDAREPLPHNVARPLADGDCIYIGAWTKIMFHAS